MNKNYQSLITTTTLLTVMLIAVPTRSQAANLDVFDFEQYGDNPSIVGATPDGTRLAVLDSGPFLGNDNQGVLALFDTTSNTLLDEMLLPIGFPGEIVYTSDNSTAYLSMTKAGGNTTTTGINQILVVDLNTLTQVDSIAIPGSRYGPFAMAFSPDGSKIYSLHRGDGRIDVIEPASNSIVDDVIVGGQAVEIRFSDDGLRAYIANRGNPVTVAVMDVATNTVSTTINPGLLSSTSSASIAVSPDKTLFVASSTDANIKIIDIDPTSANFHNVIDTIATTAQNIRKFAINPERLELYAAGADSESVITVDIDPDSSNYRTQVDELVVAGNPVWITYQPFVVADLYLTVGGDVNGFFTIGGPLSDFDLDDIVNGSDNCSGDANPDQLDSNSDGFGNVCDADLDNDCETNFSDLGLLKQAFFSTPGAVNWNPHADFDASNSIAFGDLAVMKQRFFTFPGPSGVPNLCD